MPADAEAEALRAAFAERCDVAASWLASSDAFLFTTGAGFSADSGLAVYADIARIPAYAARGLEYHDICVPDFLESEPPLFWGFWGQVARESSRVIFKSPPQRVRTTIVKRPGRGYGQCFNDYRATRPHEGYAIIRGWRDRFFDASSSSSITARVIKSSLCARADAARAARAREPHARLDDGEGAAGESEELDASCKEPYLVDSHAGAFFCLTSNVDARACDAREL